MSLPVDSQTASARGRAEPKARAKTKSRSYRILVVDDDPGLAGSFKLLLETLGHEVQALTSGRAVMAAMRELRPEIVLLDIGMPGMNGYEIAAAIRAVGLEPKPYLVAVSGYGQDSDRDAAIEAGFDRYELKPLVLEQLETLLAELG